MRRVGPLPGAPARRGHGGLLRGAHGGLELEGLGLRSLELRDGARRALVKPGIFELEAHAMTTAQRELAPRFSRMTGRGTPMRDALNAALRRGDDGTPLTRASVKLQMNDGSGGCFPLHFDGDAALDSRLVTMLCYLNEDWRAEDAGELVYHPFPRHIDPMNLDA